MVNHQQLAKKATSFNIFLHIPCVMYHIVYTSAGDTNVSINIANKA